jgi:phage terminase small subunit
MAGDKLTIKQEKYAQGLFAGLSQREAYKQAYNCDNMSDKSIDENACRLAADIKVVSRIEELTEELKERNMITVENILLELSRVAYANGSDFAKVIEKSYMKPIFDSEGKKIGEEEVFYKTVDIPVTNTIEKSKLAAIAGIKSTRDGIEVKTNDKVKALELMGKHLGMFTDNLKLSGGTNNTNTEIDVDLFNSKATEEEKKNAANLSGAEILAIMSRN